MLAEEISVASTEVSVRAVTLLAGFGEPGREPGTQRFMALQSGHLSFWTGGELISTETPLIATVIPTLFLKPEHLQQVGAPLRALAVLGGGRRPAGRLGRDRRPLRQ